MTPEEKRNQKMDLSTLTRKIVKGAEQGIPQSSLIRYITEKGGYKDITKFEKALATKRKEPAWWEKTLDFLNQGTMSPEQWGNAAEHLSGGLTLNFSNYLQAGVDMIASKLPGKKPMTYGQSFANVHKRKGKAFDKDPGKMMFAEGLGGMIPGQKLAQGLEKVSVAGMSLAPKVGEHITNFVKSVATNAATASGEATIMAGNDGRNMKEAAGMGAAWGGVLTPGMYGLGIIAKFGQRVWRRLNQAYNNKIILDPELAEEEAAQIWKEMKRRDKEMPKTVEEQLKAREEVDAAGETMSLDLAGPKGKAGYTGASIQGDTTPIFGNLALKDRQKNIRTRVGRYFSDLLGIKDVRGSMKKIGEKLLKGAQTEALPYYQQTYTAPRIKNGRVEMGVDSINDGSGRLAEKVRLILDVLQQRGKMSNKQFYNNVHSMAKLEIDQL